MSKIIPASHAELMRGYANISASDDDYNLALMTIQTEIEHLLEQKGPMYEQICRLEAQGEARKKELVGSSQNAIKKDRQMRVLNHSLKVIHDKNARRNRRLKKLRAMKSAHCSHNIMFVRRAKKVLTQRQFDLIYNMAVSDTNDIAQNYSAAEIEQELQQAAG